MKKILCAFAIVVALVCMLASCNVLIGTPNQPTVPSIAISEDGYWIINGEKTNVKAEGEKGEQGEQGIQGEKGDKGDQGVQGIQGEKGENGENGTYTNENYQGLDFFLKDDGTYIVEIGNAKYLSKIEIPATYNGRAVTEIGRFSDGDGNDILQEVIIPDSVVLIGDYAFAHCTRLNNVVIPNSVTVIGSSAFYSCDYLENITIGVSVTDIGYNVFSYCSNLNSVIFTNPNGWSCCLLSHGVAVIEFPAAALVNSETAAQYLLKYDYGCWHRGEGAEQSTPKPPVGTKVGNTCPTISLDIVGSDEKFDVQKENAEGRVVVLNFWYTTCGPCLEELPYFYEVAVDYSDRVSVAAIHIEQPGIDVTGFIANSSGHPEWNDGKMTIGWDTGMKLIDLFNISACPVTVVINTDGVITDYFVGGLHKDELISAVQKALGE